jgi:hypothetical protein
MNISNKTIQTIKKYTELDYEMCGNLRKKSNQSNELIITNANKGTNKEYRKQCNHEIITSVIFHTHPYTSYSYPSTEDVLKVFKNHGKIVRSIIATKWGIWEIKNTDKSNIYSETKKEEFIKFIKHYLDRVGRHTSNGISTNKSVDYLTDDHLQLINECTTKLEKMFNIVIDLHLWSEISEGLLF